MIYSFLLLALGFLLFYLQVRQKSLQTFDQALEWRHFYFHLTMTVVIGAEVALLNKLDFFKVYSGQNLLNISSWPLLIQVVLAVLVLDALSYYWHRLNHETYWLWEFHKFHHKSTTMDPFMAYRFHPVEVLLGYHLRAFFIWALGFDLAALQIFVFIYGALNLLQHSNVFWADSIDESLRRLIVTPRVHHIHHSQEEAHQKSNYGTIFTIWDQLFLTYRPPKPSDQIQIGLK